MRVWLCVGVFLLLVLGGETASASQDPYYDQAEKVACPAAPSGWFNPPEGAGGRVVLDPLTAVAGGASDPTEYFGSPVVEIDCRYLTKAGKDVTVRLRYALPIDLNPWNDFFIGCTSTGHPESVATSAHAWNDHERIYRIVGVNTWSLATFIDDLKQLTPSEVPSFERLTNVMLKDAQPLAHDCKLQGNGKPVDLKSIWAFNFDVQATSHGVTSTGKTSGTFDTIAGNSGGSVGAISNLAANDFRLKATGAGKRLSIELHVGAAIDFRHDYGSLLRAHVVVRASNDSGCRKGATGTLVLSFPYLSPPRIALRLCGGTYLDGKGVVSAAMKTV